MRPYVGITGFMKMREVESAVESATEANLFVHRDLMVGVLVSKKTLSGYEGSDPSDPKQFPLLHRVQEIFIHQQGVLNLVHYNSREGNLYDQLSRLRSHVPNMQGVQINIAWPNPLTLKRFASGSTDLTIVLQIGRQAMTDIKGKTDVLVKRLSAYAESVDVVLFDPSGGLGIAYDFSEAVTVLSALVASELPMRWGIAGGLGAHTVADLRPLLEIYPDLSWDAQGQLRDSDGNLDLDYCHDYLSNSARLTRGVALDQ